MSQQLQRQVSKARQFLLSKNFAPALRLYPKLIEECPGDAVLWFEYGNAAAGAHEGILADRAWDQAMKLAPLNDELIGLVGHQYQARRKPEQARACFAKAATANPRSINARISLAVLAEQNHRLEEARTAVDECLSNDPLDDQARYFQAVLDRRENQMEQAESRLRALIASEPKHPYVRYACRYELAQILDRTGRFDEAMSQLFEAKKIVNGLTDTRLLLSVYDQNAESALRFTKALPKTILKTWADSYPESNREPIPRLAFLGGHPRSGTTLLEQILDAHPNVAAFDESPAFLATLQPEFSRSRELSTNRLNKLRRQYMDALVAERSIGAERTLLVDKNPSPTARLPVWLRVFPELRVLIALRDPRDVVLSCFFQNIPLNADNVNFLSLERTAKHYGDLMDIWMCVREWEGFTWLETRYEDTVADMETEGRRVTEFLGLKWHPQQAGFHDQSRRKQLYSPTYQDVTLPVYKRSVARWTAYEKYLSPVFPLLEPYQRKWGY